MKCLYVLYDAKCAICRKCSEWLMRQTAYVPLNFIPLQSPMRQQLFPGIDAFGPGEQLLVVSDTGAVYRGGSAWVMCLWALREYRGHSIRLANPILLPFARIVCEVLSAIRYRISRWLFWLKSDDIVPRLQALSECDGQCSRSAQSHAL